MKRADVTDEEYGRLPPKKLARLKELVDKGLTDHTLPPKEGAELVDLYWEAGGELPPGVQPPRCRFCRHIKWSHNDECRCSCHR